MVADFTSEPTDFSGLYRDPSAPKDQDPSELLYRQLAGSGQATQPQQGTMAPPAPVQAPVQAPSTTELATPSVPNGTKQAQAAPTGAPTPVEGTAAAPVAPVPGNNPSSTLNPGAEQAALLARLAPLGIKSLSELKGKSEIELRKLSKDAVGYEQRQTDLAKHFFKNPDGSWDFTKGPDGRPTGLDASGHPVTAQPATPTTPAPSPAPAKKPAAKKPAAKKPAAKKPVRRSRPSTRVTQRPAARRTAPKTPAKPRTTVRKPAPKPLVKKTTLARTRTTLSAVRRTAS